MSTHYRVKRRFSKLLHNAKYCCASKSSNDLITHTINQSVIYLEQDNVHTNTESVECISIVYSVCPYKYNQ